MEGWKKLTNIVYQIKWSFYYSQSLRDYSRSPFFEKLFIIGSVSVRGIMKMSPIYQKVLHPPKPLLQLHLLSASPLTMTQIKNPQQQMKSLYNCFGIQLDSPHRSCWAWPMISLASSWSSSYDSFQIQLDTSWPVRISSPPPTPCCPPTIHFLPSQQS